jgi:2-polyprenyl-3-methyl-5-hydroxy-6-metoxy-1,4-benzoquinol methylase
MVVLTTTSGRGIEFVQGAIGKQLAFNRLLIWHKTGGRSRAVSPWQWDSVAAMLFGKAPRLAAGGSSVLITESDYQRHTDHRAELPYSVGDWLFRPFDMDASDAAGSVLDPFVGSGALLEPAVRRGVRVIGIDIEERYCEMAAKRLERSSREL